jgi:hypothetical protein
MLRVVILNVTILNVIILSVVTLNVILLNVVAPKEYPLTPKPNKSQTSRVNWFSSKPFTPFPFLSSGNLAPFTSPQITFEEFYKTAS